VRGKRTCRAPSASSVSLLLPPFRVSPPHTASHCLLLFLTGSFLRSSRQGLPGPQKGGGRELAGRLGRPATQSFNTVMPFGNAGSHHQQQQQQQQQHTAPHPLDGSPSLNTINSASTHSMLHSHSVASSDDWGQDGAGGGPGTSVLNAKQGAGRTLQYPHAKPQQPYAPPRASTSFGMHSAAPSSLQQAPPRSGTPGIPSHFRPSGGNVGYGPAEELMESDVSAQQVYGRDFFPTLVDMGSQQAAREPDRRGALTERGSRRRMMGRRRGNPGSVVGFY
jgi:hypothetical protein